MLGLSQVRKQLGELPAANGSDYRQSPSSARRNHQPTATLKAGPRLLLKLMKQLKKQKQLIKAKKLGSGRTLTNMSPLPTPCPTTLAHSHRLSSCSHLSVSSVRMVFSLVTCNGPLMLSLVFMGNVLAIRQINFLYEII